MVDSNPGSDPHVPDACIAHQIDLLYQAVLTFRDFLTQLTPCQRGPVTDALPWSDGGLEIWIDFQAWAQASLAQLRQPTQHQQLCDPERHRRTT